MQKNKDDRAHALIGSEIHPLTKKCIFRPNSSQAKMKLHERHKDFFKDVYDVVRLIPEGRVTSYGAIARYLSSAKASRMVGWAMNGAHKFPDVPAHRVVNRLGLLTGKMHFATPTAMEERLMAEGIAVEKDQIVDFHAHFWDPNHELEV